MTMGYLFHGCFCLYALIDMILMVRGQSYWFSSEPGFEIESNGKLVLKGVVTFAYSLWLCRLLAIFTSEDENDGKNGGSKSNGNSRDEEQSLLPK